MKNKICTDFECIHISSNHICLMRIMQRTKCSLVADCEFKDCFHCNNKNGCDRKGDYIDNKG